MAVHLSLDTENCVAQQGPRVGGTLRPEGRMICSVVAAVLVVASILIP
jgi:hypothetical protein